MATDNVINVVEHYHILPTDQNLYVISVLMRNTKR